MGCSGGGGIGKNPCPWPVYIATRKLIKRKKLYTNIHWYYIYIYFTKGNIFDRIKWKLYRTPIIFSFVSLNHQQMETKNKTTIIFSKLAIFGKKSESFKALERAKTKFQLTLNLLWAEHQIGMKQ